MDTTHSDSPFPPTRWTAIVKVRDADNTLLARRALGDLCRDYWYPLYAYARRFGCAADDAPDVTQGFLAYMVERNLLAGADQQLGKLRTFLLTAFKRYIGDLRDKERALKRGGGAETFSFDADEGEERYVREPADSRTPESVFERTWAFSVLRGAVAVLAVAEEKAGRGAQFAALEPFVSLDTKGEPDTAAAARTLGTTEENVRQIASRLRKKFRDMLRQCIADTLNAPTEAQIDDELAALRAALRNG